MSKLKGKQVLVVGFGKSGVAAARYLSKQGAKVTVTDSKQKTELKESVDACIDLKIEYELGKHNPKSFVTAEVIVVSPGVPLNLKPLDEAREKNIPIISEVEVAVAAIESPIIAVTGTNGKTTTTALIGEMFKEEGRTAFVGGNIGTPLLNLLLDPPEKALDVVVAELSSFQLELHEKMVPAVAVFTNLEEAHQDRYTSFDQYKDAKKRLLKACDRNSYLVLNYDCPTVAAFAQESPARVIWFTKKDPLTVGGEFAERFTGCYYKPEERKIICKITGKEEVYELSQYRLFGEHNKENLMAAICAARAMGVSPAAIQRVIVGFKGVAHRLEFVRKKDGVYFFNDSKATNVMSLRKSISSFPNHPVNLIAGGKDRGADFTSLGELVRKRVKVLILVGEAKERINRAIGDFAETFIVGTFEEAVLLSFQKSRAGDIVLLSPGCPSQDMFRNFEERGDYFKKLVNQI